MSLAMEMAGVLAGGVAAAATAGGALAAWTHRAVRPAALQRRLRTATAALRTTVPASRRRAEPSMLQELAAVIEELAAHTDRAVILAGTASGATRHRLLREAASEVARVEELADRLRVVAAEMDPAAIDARRWRHQAARVDATLANYETAGNELRSLDDDWAEDLIRRKATR